MTEFEGTIGFPSGSDDLPRVPLGRWERFLMAAVAPAKTFDEFVGPLPPRLRGVPFAKLVYDARGARDFLLNPNGAPLADKYPQGFHTPDEPPGPAPML